MSELDDFLKWGAHVGEKGERDSFGNLFGNQGSFPYGTISYWIREYKLSQIKQRL